MGNTLKSSSTVLQARLEVGEALSQPNAAQQLKKLNTIRDWAYAQQRNLGLNLSVSLCVPLEKLCRECPPCPDQPEILGFRLPSQYQSVEVAKLRDEHVPIYSPFRSPYDGVSGYANDGAAKLFDNGYACTERDFTDCEPSAIRFHREGHGETTQQMVVTGVTYEDREEKYTYDVTSKAKVSNEVFKRLTKIVFPSGVSGCVVLAEPNGRELSRYGAKETIPQFREFRMIGGCCPTELVLDTKCTFRPLSDDQELVEFGSPIVWNTLARYIQLLYKSDSDSNDRANMQSYLATASNLIIEQAAVQTGGAVTGKFQRKSMTGKRLSRGYYGARRRR